MPAALKQRSKATPKSPKRKKARSLTDQFFKPRDQRNKMIDDEATSRTLAGQRPKKKPSEKTKVKPKKKRRV